MSRSLNTSLNFEQLGPDTIECIDVLNNANRVARQSAAMHSVILATFDEHFSKKNIER